MIERPFPPRRSRARKRKALTWPDWPSWVYYLVAALLVLLTLPLYAKILAAFT